MRLTTLPFLKEIRIITSADYLIDLLEDICTFL